MVEMSKTAVYSCMLVDKDMEKEIKKFTNDIGLHNWDNVKITLICVHIEYTPCMTNERTIKILLEYESPDECHFIDYFELKYDILSDEITHVDAAWQFVGYKKCLNFDMAKLALITVGKHVIINGMWNIRDVLPFSAASKGVVKK